MSLACEQGAAPLSLPPPTAPRPGSSFRRDSDCIYVDAQQLNRGQSQHTKDHTLLEDDDEQVLDVATGGYVDMGIDFLNLNHTLGVAPSLGAADLAHTTEHQRIALLDAVKLGRMDIDTVVELLANDKGYEFSRRHTCVQAPHPVVPLATTLGDHP